MYYFHPVFSSSLLTVQCTLSTDRRSAPITYTPPVQTHAFHQTHVTHDRYESRGPRGVDGVLVVAVTVFGIDSLFSETHEQCMV
ncbi:hypothetical protein EVAR_98451_1 [Eumeta japonica]|uniref:Uncharacterized protein n=1 Tax=Eumeta variegata TaxID=151549 RepID=A0A4C1YNN2_EUMVA|nr:hypothetical protein EVAR_98451_1 [Eumeta japonica]